MAIIFLFDDLTMNDDLFRILSWTRSARHRVARHNTIGGTRVVPIARDATVMSIGGLYAPAGYAGGKPPVRTPGTNWYRPDLESWENRRGTTGELRTGRMNFGEWTLESFESDYQALAILSVESGIAPRAVQWDAVFVAVNESISISIPRRPGDL